MEADRTVWRRGTAVEPAAATNTTMLVERSVILLLVGLLLLGVGACPAAVCHRDPFCPHPGSRHLAAPPAAGAAGLSPGLAATLLSLGGVMAIGLPMLAIAPRLATRLAEGARGVEAALIALPSVPPDWIARNTLGRCAADWPMAAGSSRQR